MKVTGRSPAATAWYVLGGLVAVGAAFMFFRELPSMRREMRLMRM